MKDRRIFRVTRFDNKVKLFVIDRVALVSTGAFAGDEIYFLIDDDNIVVDREIGKYSIKRGEPCRKNMENILLSYL